MQNICIDLLLYSILIKRPSYRFYPNLAMTLELFLLILPGDAGTDLQLYMCMGLISQIHAIFFVFFSIGPPDSTLWPPQNKHLFGKSRQCPFWSPICRRQLRGRYSTEEPELPYSAPLFLHNHLSNKGCFYTFTLGETWFVLLFLLF